MNIDMNVSKRTIKKLIYHVIMIGISFLMMYPLFWMLASSFKPENQIMQTATELIPRKVTFENYINGWKGVGKYNFGDFLKNTLIIAIPTMVGTTISCSLVAFAFARIRFVTRKFWIALMIFSMCLPAMVFQIPRYLLFNSWGWVGTWLPIIVPPFFANAYDVFMLMQFMKGIPREIDEAAEIDGCGWFGLFSRIMLPLVKPAVTMVAVLSFMAAWGDFYSALIYLNKPAKYPIALGLKLYMDEARIEYGPVLGMSVISLIPIIIIFIIFQKSLIDGIAVSGIKG